MSDIQPKKSFVQTVFKGRIEVRCPVCGHDEFLPAEPEDMAKAKREGFRHVRVGVFGDASLVVQPVRFQHCANCGYILTFVIGKFDETDGQP
jgi:ribosomal protein S27E